MVIATLQKEPEARSEPHVTSHRRGEVYWGCLVIGGRGEDVQIIGGQPHEETFRVEKRKRWSGPPAKSA